MNPSVTGVARSIAILAIISIILAALLGVSISCAV